MTKPRNGNRKCPNCRHFYAAHGYELGTDRRPCVVPSCLCVTLEKEEVKFRERTKNEVGDLG